MRSDWKFASKKKDIKRVWKWVQRSKARSLSDLLGLRSNIPENLLTETENNPDAKVLFDEHETFLLRLRIVLQNDGCNCVSGCFN